MVPLHFVFEGDRIYVHFAFRGKKLDNLRVHSAVCFEADEMVELQIIPEKPCSSGTYYRSVIATGTAAIVDDPCRKLAALQALADKYAAGRTASPVAPEAVEKTCVVEIVVEEISGKARLP